jgi:hypothetical protein
MFPSGRNMTAVGTNVVVLGIALGNETDHLLGVHRKGILIDIAVAAPYLWLRYFVLT